MPERLSITDTLDAVRVYCYYSIQNDEEDVFDEISLFDHLNGRVSKAMLRIALQELGKSEHLEARVQKNGARLYRATIKLLQTVEAFLALKQLSPAEWLEQNVGKATAATDNVSSDTWEPLKNESNASQKEEVISAIEDVVRQVEADNGFAANQPEARNSLIYSLKVGVKMLKEHTPSREQITANILKPLKYIGDLFAKHSIGELAKKAIEKLLLWLSGF
jgi:hypothetical protein